MKNIFKALLKPKFLIYTGIGIIGGFAYYYFIGCSSGTCPITSNPITMTFYGGLMGAVLGFDMSKPKNANQTEASIQE